MALRPRTIVLGAIGVAVVGALLFVALRTDPIPVDLAKVELGPMRVTIDADGKTRIREIYEIAAPIAGTALRSPVRVGDPVVAGSTVVAVVEPVAPTLLDSRSRQQAEAAVREADAARQVAASQLRQAEEDFTYAQTQFDRAKTLVERGVASVTQLEDATQRLAIREAALEAAHSGLAMAEGSLERARAALIEPGEGGAAGGNGECCVELHSPVSGRVLDVPVVSERPVAAGTTLLSVGEPDDLEIVADLLSSDAVRLSVGAPALVERWGGPDPLDARLATIEPAARTKVSALGIEEQRVDVVFDLVSPHEARAGLADGFSVFLRIVEWQADDVVQAPLSALWRREGDWAVFVANGTSAEARAVEIGRRNSRTAQVLSGLEPGEAVIIHPSDDLVDGAEIVDRRALRN